VDIPENDHGGPATRPHAATPTMIDHEMLRWMLHTSAWEIGPAVAASQDAGLRLEPRRIAFDLRCGCTHD
jgi:hypothetical protein